MSKTITYALYPKLRKRKVTKTYEQGYGQNGGVSSLGVAYEDTDSDGVLDTVVKNSTRIGAFKRTVGVVRRSYRSPAEREFTVDNIAGTSMRVKLENVPNTGQSLILVWGETDESGTSTPQDHEDWDDFATLGVVSGTATRLITGLATDTNFYLSYKHGSEFGPVLGPFRTLANTGSGGAPSYTTAVAYADLATLTAATPTVGAFAYITSAPTVFYIGDGSNWLIYNP